MREFPSFNSSFDISASYTRCAIVEIARCAQDDDLLRLIAMSPVPTLCWQLDNLTIRDANQAPYDLTGHAAGTLSGQNLDNLGLCKTKAARQKSEQEVRLSERVVAGAEHTLPRLA